MTNNLIEWYNFVNHLYLQNQFYGLIVMLLIGLGICTIIFKPFQRPYPV